MTTKWKTSIARNLRCWTKLCYVIRTLNGREWAPTHLINLEYPQHLQPDINVKNLQFPLLSELPINRRREGNFFSTSFSRQKNFTGERKKERSDNNLHWNTMRSHRSMRTKTRCREEGNFSIMKIREKNLFWIINFEFFFGEKFSEGDKVELIMPYSTMIARRKDVDKPSFFLDTQSEIQILIEEWNQSNGCVLYERKNCLLRDSSVNWASASESTVAFSYWREIISQRNRTSQSFLSAKTQPHLREAKNEWVKMKKQLFALHLTIFNYNFHRWSRLSRRQKHTPAKKDEWVKIQRGNN